MRSVKQRKSERVSKWKMAFAIALSACMIAAMAPAMAPKAMFADEETASTGAAFTPDGGAGQPAPEGENGEELATPEDNAATPEETATTPEETATAPEEAATVPAEAIDVSEEAADVPEGTDEPGEDMATSPAAAEDIEPFAAGTPVTSWAQLSAAISDTTVTRVAIESNLSFEGNLPAITRDLVIDGGGHTIDFRVKSDNFKRAGFILGYNVNATFTLKNVKIVRPVIEHTGTEDYGLICASSNATNSLPAHSTTGNLPESGGWIVNIEDLQGTGSASRGNLISLPNGAVNFRGNVVWASEKNYALINAKTVNFDANSTATLSSVGQVIRSSRPNCSVTATAGAQAYLYSRDAQAVWMQTSAERVPTSSAGSATLVVKDGAVLDISGDGHGTGEEGSTVSIVAYSGGYTVSGGGKLYVRSLCGKAGRPNTNGTIGQPAMISQITNGQFNVDGEGSLLDVESYGNENNAGATIRFRDGGGQKFNITNKAKAYIVKQERAGGESCAAIQFGKSPNNEFHVNSGGVAYIENFGNGIVMSPSTGNDDNAAITYLYDDFVFDVSGYKSAIEIVAHCGAAINALTHKNGTINVGEGSIFVAKGVTSSPAASTGSGANSVIFKAGENLNFTANKPLYYDFVNMRPGGGGVFNTKSGTFTADNSDVAVWGNGLNGRGPNPIDGNPYRSWTNISYVVNGPSYNHLVSSSNPDFNTGNDSFGSMGMTPYTRISGNNASAMVDDLYPASNAEKSVRGHIHVPEGIDEGRGAWDDEVWTELEVTPVDGSAPYKVVARSLEKEDLYLTLDDTSKTTVDGVMRYDKEAFLVPGDKYRILRAWRGDKDPSSANVHMSTASDLTGEVMTVVDRTPPTPPVITDPPSTLFIGNSVVKGTYAAIEPAHNPEPAVRMHAVLVKGGATEGEPIKSSGNIVYAVMDTVAHTWTYTLPSDVALAAGDKIYFVAEDKNGNVNPIGDKAYREATFPAAHFLTVGDGPKNFKKSIVDPADSSKTVQNLTVSDPEAPITYRMTSDMPAKMSGITSVELRDIMGNDLTLKDGDASNVKVTAISGAPAPTISWDASAKTVKVLYAGNATQMDALAGKTISIDIVATLVGKDGAYPTSAVNSGQIYSSGEKVGDLTNPPVIHIMGKVSGTLFNDNNKDGIFNSGDTASPGKIVKLYRWDGNAYAEVTNPTGTAMSTVEGKYEFTELGNGRYRIAAPKDAVKGYTVQKALSVTDGSHVGNDGYSHEFEIGSASLTKTVNAGYATPAVNPPGGGGLNKKLVLVDSNKNGLEDVGESASGPITDSEADLIYNVEYRMPDNTAGYNHLEIQDVMDAGLVLKGEAVSASNVVVTARKGNVGITVTPAATYPSYKQGTGTDAGKMVIAYKFADDTDFAALAGATVTMKVTATLKKAADGTWPAKVTNLGRLIVNEAQTVTPPVSQNNTGRIYGIAFGDTNRNGQLDSDEPRLKDITVTLKKWDASADGGTGAYVAYTPGVSDTAITTDSGEYNFFVPEGRYRVEFPALAPGNKGITTNAPNAPKSGVVPDVNIAYGPSSTQTRKIDVGYSVPDLGVLSELEKSFTKRVWDPALKSGAGDWTESRNVTDSKTVFEYKIKFDLPKNASDLAGFSSIKIDDVMPEGLTLDLGAGNVVVKAGDQTIYTSTAAGDGSQAGRTASYTFDAAAIQKMIADGLTGKEVSMTVKAKLEKLPSGVYPDSVTNSGRMTVNSGDAPLVVQPKSTVGDGVKIEGMLWYDIGAGANAGNGKIDADEKGVEAGKAVILYAESDTSLSTPIATSNTDANGRFILNTKPDGSPIPAGRYVIKYPPIKGYAFVVTSTDGGATGTNVGSNSGVSRVIDADLDTKQSRVSNAGYKTSTFIDPNDPEAFTKSITGVSGTGILDASKNEVTTSVPQKDSFIYRVKVKMPGNMFPYSTDAVPGGGVEIRDLMGASLVLDGSTGDVKVTVTDSSGGAVSGLSPIVAWDAAAGKLSVKFTGSYSSIMSKLEHTTVTVDYPAKLKVMDGTYPSSATNEARIYLNGADSPEVELPDKDKPKVTVKGKISGLLFTDSNRDGIFGVGEPTLVGKPVALYKATDSALASPVATATTTSGGLYSFFVEPGNSYIIKAAAPDSGYGYTKLVPADSRVAGNTYNDVGNRGTSQSVETSRDKDGANLEKSVNAGYALVDINNSPGAFTKDLVNVGGEATAGPIHDSTADLVYDIVYKMPASAVGYNALELLDIMQPGLVLKGGEAAKDTSITVKVDGKAMEGGTKAYAAGTGGDAGKMVASYKFPADYDFSALAGKSVTMTVTAKLEQVSGAWPTKVTNTGRLIVNESTSPPKEAGPNEETNTGRIYGLAFDDANRNGTVDSGEKGISGVSVGLYRAADSAFASPIYTASTDADGKYSFDIPAGDYTVKFATPISGGKGITTTGQTNGNTRTAPVSGVAAGIKIALGTRAEQTEEVIAGYNTPDKDVLDRIHGTFKKQVKDGDGYVDTKTITNYGELIEYKISFLLPTKAAVTSNDPVAGFSSVKIEDIMDEGLTTATVDADGWNVAVYVGGTQVDIGSAKIQGSRTVGYTFDAAKIQQYMSGKASDTAGLEIYMIVKAKLEMVGESWPKTAVNKGRLTINEISKDTGGTTLVVGGKGPEIKFTQYPLVLTQSAVSHILTTSELKDKMEVTDDIDNPTWEDTDVTTNDLFKNTTAVPIGIGQIDRHNIGVYPVSYTATDSNGNSTTRIRAVVVTDGRYVISVTDDGDDTNDIIIGARNFVAKAQSIDGSESQAKSLSYAEAYDGLGNAKAVTWTGAPAGYVQTATKPGDYPITWKASGYSAAKTIKATIVNADEVYPSDRNGQYAIVASHFLRNTAQAAAMLGADLDKNLIAAANARVFKLVDDTDPSAPGDQPLPDKGIVVLTRGSDQTGPFSATPNTYPIDYGIEGLISHHVLVNGVVSDGKPPILTVTTPDNVTQGAVYDDARYMNGVRATDPDGDKHGTPDPSDDTPTDITARVKYGTLTATPSGPAFTEGKPVIATKAGVYTVDYRVTDDDGNRADARRVVVVNDGSYALGKGNILKANSFVTRLADVTDIAANIKSEIRSKSKAVAINGSTGIPFDLDDRAVANDGGYRKAAGIYDITITAPDAPDGTISKGIKGKVVAADVIEEGPTPANPGSTDRYYVYGNNIRLTVSEAQAIKGAADYNAALLNALDAHADRVSGSGTITDAFAKITSDGGFEAKSGIYRIKVSDAVGHVTAELTATVSNGNGPIIAATPIPLVINAVTTPGNLTKAQIFSGVTVRDVEDTKDVVTAWDALPSSGPQVEITGGPPQIKADVGSVTKVTYRYTDSDGNPAEVSRAIVVNDGRYMVNDQYILEANSFIIGKSQVKAPYDTQILEKSNAKAWRSDGTPAVAVVKDTAGYKDEVGSYFVMMGIANYADMTKQIQAMVIDDSNPPGGGGQEGENGDRYSIMANNFRINLTDAKALQQLAVADYNSKFISRADATSYQRATQQPKLVLGGTPKLDSVVKKGPAPTDFKSSALAEGDIFLATFSVTEEPGTKVTIEVLVSNANPPTLTVPPVKVVTVGAVFPEGSQADTAPSYYQGVSASDVEDGTISQGGIRHDSPVNTATEAAFLVTYSVTDSDHNTTTKGGMVLVGDGWRIASGYAISAHDFSKEIGDVSGTEAEAISESKARAVDVRPTLPDGKPNPNFGKAVPIKVKSDGGYYGKTPGTFDITFAVTEKDDVTKTIKATVGKGKGPEIKFTQYPLVLTQSAISHILTTSELKAAMTATDPEDGDVLADPVSAGAKGTTATTLGIGQIDRHNIGVYPVSYTATDSNGNTATRTRAVVVTDGRYVISVTDDGDDTNDIIIGARNFVAKAQSIDGSESQAKSLSYAEAYDGLGNAKAVTWTGAPAGYVQTATKPGDYPITWKASGYSAAKTIKATIVNADEVYPSDRNGQYAIVASHFLRNTAQAAAMLGADLDKNLIAAANARVFKLVDDTDPSAPGNQPLPDKGIVVLTRGSDQTGPFSATPNTYPIDYGIEGLISHHVLVNGVVSDGKPPILTVTTPDNVTQGAVYDEARYMNGVRATDPDGDKHGTPDPSDDTPTDITARVKYGTLTATPSGPAFTEGKPVITTKAGVYTVDYRVTDDDGNRADARRVVVVNDGSYALGKGNILKANSFVTKVGDVTSDATLIKSEIRSKSKAVAISGSTGIPFDLDDKAVANDGGYRKAAGIYDITITAPDAPDGTISKGIKGKVVAADVIEEGPTPANPGSTDRYYVYGNNIHLTISGAQAIKGAADYSAALLKALDAHADRVSGDGTITDAFAKITSDGGFEAKSGIYRIKVSDAGGHVTAELTVTVSNGNGPIIAATPIPLVINAVTTPGNLTKAQVFSGVTVRDVEDTKDVATAWDALPSSGPQVEIIGGMPQIKADVSSVTKVTYRYTDSDGNPAEVSRAIVVNDGRYMVNDKYILEANSFIIGKSQVKAPYDTQILEKSNAKAWRSDGTPAVAVVKDTAGYKDEIGSYGIMMGIANYADMTKRIEARVIDDSNPPGGGGQEGENGDRYSIKANNFRINLTDAKALQQVSGVSYGGEFIKRSDAASYQRATQQTHLVRGGTPKLDSVVKKGAAPTDFKAATLSEGDIFLATFSVAEEPGTKVTIEVLVSNANPPHLTVPPVKVVPVGAAFPEGSQADTVPSYYQGVSASDVEDGTIPQSRISHDSPVNTSIETVFHVTYSVTDSDHNTTTKKGMVLVGSWVVGAKYAIMAHDFSKTLGQVNGSETEMINSAEAKAVCIDPTDPNYGKTVEVTVMDNGGYPRKMVGKFSITLAVKAETNTKVTIVATVGTGGMPILDVPSYKHVDKGTVFGEIQYMQGVTATDSEDGNITNKVIHDSPVNTAVEGYYAISYSVTDSDGNTARRIGMVLVGSKWFVKDGYAINAYDFSKRVSEVIGTSTDMISSARVQAICVNPSSANYGKAVAATVADDGGYPRKAAGKFNITFAVQEAPGVTKSVTATVTSGASPVLTVPPIKNVPEGGGFDYMAGVTAIDPEEGDITSKVTHDTPVNTNSPGAYNVTYSVTDSDGNTVQKRGIALVGTGWIVKGGYALYAQDFAKKLSEITGTGEEAIRLAKATAIWIADSSSPDFGKYVSVTIVNNGGYKKTAGNYRITFAVYANTSVAKTITASIIDDVIKPSPKPPTIIVNPPKPPNVTVKPPKVTVKPPGVTVRPPLTRPPTVIISPAVPTPVPTPAPIVVTPTTPQIIEVPVPTQYVTPEPIYVEEPPIPLNPEPEDEGAWHLVDLILVIVSMILGFFLMSHALRRRDEYGEPDTDREKQIRLWGPLGILLSIASVIALLLTQNFSYTMRIVDIWVILFAVICGVEVLAVIGVTGNDEQEWDEEQNIEDINK